MEWGWMLGYFLRLHLEVLRKGRLGSHWRQLQGQSTRVQSQHQSGLGQGRRLDWGHCLRQQCCQRGICCRNRRHRLGWTHHQKGPKGRLLEW